MECDICHRGHDTKRLPFLCVVDARNQIYESRIQNLQLLLENDGLQKEIADMVEDTATPSKDRQDTLIAQQRIAEDRTSQILASADKLRADIQEAYQEIQARKAAIARRRSDLASVSSGLAQRRDQQQEEAERAIRIIEYSWAQRAGVMTRTRSFLCMEAARLYGLKRVKRGTGNRYDYYIGRIAIFDLTTMNSLSPEAISTSLGHVAHMLMLAAHYLAVRLPAAITLPHRDYPNPTIFNISSSYKQGDAIFPGDSRHNLPASVSRDLDSHHVPRPRPLFVDKPLPQLFKEDPSTYAYFLEGVTLLAYNVAWLCCTQGISIGDRSSFDDVCNMGRNLFSLLINQQSSIGRAPPLWGDDNSSSYRAYDSALESWVGRWSHGTMFYPLGGADGSEFVKSFKLPGPLKLADKLKKKLINDAPAPDWEMLEDDEWKTEEVLPENQVDKAKVTDGKGSSRSSSGGWMRVKNR